MKKISFCHDWQFREIGQEKQSVLLPHDATQLSGREAGAASGSGGWVFDAKDMAFAKPYPWKLADTGVLDILGNDNAEAGLAAVVWDALTKPYIAVRPLNNHGKPWAHAAFLISQGNDGRWHTVSSFFLLIT